MLFNNIKKTLIKNNYEKYFYFEIYYILEKTNQYNRLKYIYIEKLRIYKTGFLLNM